MGIVVAALGLAHCPANAAELVIDNAVASQFYCGGVITHCSTVEDTTPVVGGVDQGGLIETAAFEYLLPGLPKDATITAAYMSIGGYARDPRDGRQGFQDGAIGTIDLTAYVGNGVVDQDDTDHRGTVDVTMTHAVTNRYDITDVVEAFVGAGDAYLGFSIYQSPAGVCDFAPYCEVALTGDTHLFDFKAEPQLIIDFVETPPPPPLSGTPEPATWAMLIGGFALVGGAMRRRRAAACYA
jgi:hypothetical protein